MTRTQQISSESLETLTTLKKKTHAWLWMSSTSASAAVVVVPVKTDPDTNRFAALVGEVLGEQGAGVDGIRGMISRLPSGALSLSVRESPDAVLSIHAEVCRQFPEAPTMTVIQMRGSKVVKAAQSVAPEPDPFGGMGGEDDIWSALM